jgi:hypothetical protein
MPAYRRLTDSFSAMPYSWCRSREIPIAPPDS